MANWIQNGSATVGLNSVAVTAPNNTNTAFVFNRTNASGHIGRLDEITCDPDVDYLFSIFVRGGSLTNPGDITLRVGPDITNEYVEAVYDLDANIIKTGPIVVGTNIVRPIAHIEGVGGGWYSIQIGFAYVRSTNLDIYLTTGNSLTGTLSDSSSTTAYFWSPTLERRRLEDDPSYLGTAYSGVFPAIDTEFSYIPVYRETTNSITYTTAFGDTTIGVPHQGTNFTTGNSVDYVQVPQFLRQGTPSRVVINNNRGEQVTLVPNNQAVYAKRSPVRVTFVNKQGVLETFWAIRKTVEHVGVTTESYYRNVVDYENLTYNEHQHTKQQYNTVGRKRWTINTDNIPEHENSFMEELHMSEYIWLTYRGRTFPVNRMGQGFSYKTHVNDKLVQYELNFMESNRLDNTIR